MSKSDNYKSLFVEPSKNIHLGCNVKMVCLSEASHRRLRMVVCAIHERGVTLTSYLETVLAHHFKEYQGEISEMLDDILQSTNTDSDSQ